jgi:hypothetical protein
VTSDGRLYARFTLDYADSHKIAPLSDAAFRAHVRMVLWSRRYLTDGKIPARMALVIAGKTRVLDELTANDPINPSLVRDEAGDYWLHDFLEHQPSRLQVEARQEANRANGSKGGQARSKRTGSESLSKPVSESLSEIQASTYTESETETTTQVSDESSVLETGAFAGTDGLHARARVFGFDPDRVRRELGKVLQEIPDDDTVMRVATTVLGNAASPAKNPTAYLVRSIRNSEFEVQKIAFGGAA